MAYDVSALSNYTKEFETDLVLKSTFSAKTASLVQSGGLVLSGVKSSGKIPYLETDVVFQAGGSCGFSSSGTTTFSDRTVTVGKIKINESLCPKSLEAKAIQKKMKKGSKYDAIPFEQEYSEYKAVKLAEALEVADWQGDTTSGSANLSKYDGYLKLIDAAAASITATNVKAGTGTITATTGSTSVSGSGTAFTTEVAVGDKIYNASGVLVGTVASITNATTLVLSANGAVAVTAGAFIIAPAAGYHFSSLVTSITTSNVRNIVDGVWMSFPAAVKGADDAVIFCGWDVFEKQIKAMQDANLYHHDPNRQSGELVIPGTQYKLIAVHGLNSTDRLIGIRLSNMVLAVDMENEEEKFEIFYAKEADEVRYVNEFKRGVQVSLPAEIVSFKKLPA